MEAAAEQKSDQMEWNVNSYYAQIYKMMWMIG